MTFLSTPARRPASGRLLLGLALTLAACAGPTAPGQRALVAAVQARTILITNQTAAPVFTFTTGARAAALINWAPCVDESRCPPVAPGATSQEAYPAPFQGAAESAAIVYWWHAVRGPGGALRPDTVRAIQVGL